MRVGALVLQLFDASPVRSPHAHHAAGIRHPEEDISLGEPPSRFGDDVKHRLQITAGTAQDPKHIDDRPMLLAQLSQLR